MAVTVMKHCRAAALPSRVASHGTLSTHLARKPCQCRAFQPAADCPQPSQQPIHEPQQHIGPSVQSSVCGLQSSSPATRANHTPAIATLVATAAVLTSLTSPECAHALQVEPANALSLPTWAIHVSSVVEWVIAMGLVWRYAEVTGNSRWKGLTWGMLPALGSAACACTWHLFYNSPDLEFLVGLQALLTVVGNTTCLIAAYRIWAGARSEASSS